MAKVATREIHRDDEPIFMGTHKGGQQQYPKRTDDDGGYIFDDDGDYIYSDPETPSSVLYDKNAHFKSLGLNAEFEQYCENETQGTGGAITAVTETTVTVTGVTWYYGDTYNIYATATKGSHISSVWCDVSRGWKIEHPKDANKDGWRWEDIDLDDRGRKKVFGPGQPEKY